MYACVANSADEDPPPIAHTPPTTAAERLAGALVPRRGAPPSAAVGTGTPRLSAPHLGSQLVVCLPLDAYR